MPTLKQFYTQTLKALKSAKEFAFEFLMPTNPQAKTLSLMSLEDFTKTVRKSSDQNENINSVFSYKDPLVRELVRQIKFRGNKKMARMGSALLYDSIIGFMNDTGYFSGFENPIILPVPISEKRARERGYNQSALLAEEIVKIDDGVNFELKVEAIRKIKNTVPQTSLKRAEREKNLIGCFAVPKPEIIKDRNIIIIDDVYTTGSTIKELRKILLEAGAKQVVGFTIAH